MHRHKRVIKEAEGEKADADDVQHEFAPDFQRYVFLCIRLKLFRVRKVQPGDDQEHKGQDSRDGKCKETETVALKCAAVSLEEHYDIEEQGAEYGAELVKQFLKAESLSGSFPRGGKGNYSILGGLFYGLAEFLDHQQYAGGNPPILPHKSQGGDGDQFQTITNNDDRPVFAGAVSEFARHEAEGIAHKFPKSGDQAYCRCGRTHK